MSKKVNKKNVEKLKAYLNGTNIQPGNKTHTGFSTGTQAGKALRAGIDNGLPNR